MLKNEYKQKEYVKTNYFYCRFYNRRFCRKAQDNKVAVFDPAGDVTSSIKEIVREEISASIVNMTDYTVWNVRR